MRLGMGLGLGNLLSGGPITGMSNKYSFNFDGSNDYLDCGADVHDFSSGNFTVSAWVYHATGNSNHAGIFGIRDSTNTELQFYIREGGTGDGKLGSWNGSDNVFSSSTIAEGEWTHVALVQDSGDKRFYVNGSADGVSSQGNGTARPATLKIGYTGNGSEYFKGKIDEVAVWSVALSANDIAKIGSKPSDLSKASAYATDRTSNFKLWLRAGDKVLPEEDASIARSDFYTDFDGSNDYVSVEDNNDLSFGDGSADSPFSICAWINMTDATAFTILNKGVYNTDGEWNFRTNSSDKLVFALYDESVADTHESMVSDSAITAYEGNWTHVAGTYNGVGGTSANAGLKLYIDGSSLASTGSDSGTYVAMENLGGDVYAGRMDSSYADGKISNVSIYKTTLDAQTIKQFAKSRFTPMRDNRFSVVDFDGTNDYIDCGDDTSLDITSTITISGWVYLNQVDESCYIIGREDGAVRNYILFAHSDGKFYFQINISSSTKSVGSTTTYVANRWYHVSGTYDGSRQKIYVDGVLEDDDAETGSIDNGDASLVIGAAADNDKYFNGAISSASLYNTAKSADEVYAIYQQGITYDESSLSGLVGYWRMGDDTSKAYPTIADSSSNSNDGTITNGASDDIVQQMVAGYDMGAFESTGEELNVSILVNGDFDTDSDWSKGTGWTISDGKARCDGTQTGNTNLQTSVAPLTSGTLYKVTFDLTRSAGNFRFLIGSSGSSDYYTTDGTHSFYKVEDGNDHVYAQGDSNFVGTLDNVKVQTILQSADLSDTYPAIIDVNEPVLGAEVNPYPDFSNSTGYTVGTRWAIDTSAGTATYDYVDTGGTSWLYQQGTSLDNAKFYKVTITLDSVGGNFGGSGMRHGGGDHTWTQLGISSLGTTVLYLKPSSATIRIWGHSVDLVVSYWSIKEVKGNPGTMTNQAADDLVYSSVLPDQSFLTGVNSAYNYIDLDGSDEYIAHSNISFTGAFSISSWINLDNVSSGRPIVGDTGNNNWFKVVDADTAGIRIAGGTATEWDAGMTFSTGSWAYVAVVRNASNEIIVYVNGVAYTSNQPTLSGTYVLNALGQKGNGQYFDGKIGQIALYNKALSATEVGAIYSLGRHGNLLDKYADNLKGYWAMSSLDASTGLSDVGDGTIYDRSGQSNHGTATNTEAADLTSSPNADPNGYAKGDTNRSTDVK